jgi:hypothetical protein
MTILRKAALAALLTAPFCFSPAFAQDHMMAGDAMAGDAMGHDAMGHDMNVTCSVADMGSDGMGMTIMFHNMGSDAVPAGTKAHWKVRGMAQGDVSFMEPLAPNGMKEQMYMGHEMMHGAKSTPCTVSMM